jgi:phosphatidylglycerol:prolipoprotein diacylglycerol transferase
MCLVFGTLFGFKIYSYATIHLVAWAVFSILIAKLFRKHGIHFKSTIAISGLYLFCNLIGARLLWMLKERQFSTEALTNILAGGFWGWLLLFFPLVLVYLSWSNEPRQSFLESFSIALFPTFALQKIACFIAGCCWGTSTYLPWAVHFPQPNTFSIPNTPVHPVQVYDAVLPIIGLFGFSWLANISPKLKPFWFPFLVGFYSVSRFTTEFYRGDLVTQKSVMGVLSLTQAIELTSASLVMVGLIFFRERWIIFLKKQGIKSKLELNFQRYPEVE